MPGGGDDAPPPGPSNGGEFLLSLLQRSYQLQQQPPPQQLQPQPLTLDPAVAAVRPTLPFPLHRVPSNGYDPSPLWPQAPSPPRPTLPHPHSYAGPSDDPGRLGLRFGVDSRRGESPGLQNLRFGAFPLEVEPSDRLPRGNSIGSSSFDSVREPQAGSGNRNHDRFGGRQQLNERDRLSYLNSNPIADATRHWNFDPQQREQSGMGWGKQQAGSIIDSRLSAPPGFERGAGNRGLIDLRRGGFEHNAGEVNGNSHVLNHRNKLSISNGSMLPRGLPSDGNRRVHSDRVLVGQVDHEPRTAHPNHMDKSVRDMNRQHPVDRNGGQDASEIHDLGEQLADSSLLDDPLGENKHQQLHRVARDKEYRSDSRGQRVLSQRMRNDRRRMECRRDIDRLNDRFLLIYESLIPPDEEKVRQKQLLSLLERLVNKEWPEARLYLYGSCANSFGVCKSDIDVCLAIQGIEIDKAELLLKLADILQSDNLQNVQALTRARVPIVKLMDPVTGISCDICVNNVLAVINTRLLRDYAQIDVRLRQLAYIVKHWAKSRGVNETYQGTLSSYAYVLMCIHFLQLRRPAILPCLQEMEPTYTITVDGINCTFFDQVEKLRDFGSRNKESIAQLVWAFFNYWAYHHDYTDSVISVRTGSLLSKQAKDWTRRIGNDRHLICIEDPFDTKHDLGRVVDKFSIKVLREEFERAAAIMQDHPSPWIALFEPYRPVPAKLPN